MVVDHHHLMAVGHQRPGHGLAGDPESDDQEPVAQLLGHLTIGLTIRCPSGSQ